MDASGSLDPDDWSGLRALGHRMLDDLFDDLEAVGHGPVWRAMPDEVRAAWRAPLPRGGTDPEQVYADYRRLVAPYGAGNRHPRFFGCRDGGLWFHVDAAFGALAMLSPRLRPLLHGIEQADSVAFDFHKWGQVPYDAGCIVVRDQGSLRAAFTRDAAYLQATGRGLAAGEPWPVDLGPELSRGFRALKVWMTIRTYGADRLAGVVERCCALAQRLAAYITRTPELELVAPVALNIVCFRVRAGDDAWQEDIACRLQEAGRSVLSTTTVGGRRVLRAAIVNHRTAAEDVDAIVQDVLWAVGLTVQPGKPAVSTSLAGSVETPSGIGRSGCGRPSGVG